MPQQQQKSTPLAKNSAAQPPKVSSKPKRHRLFAFPLSYWHSFSSESTTANDVTTVSNTTTTTTTSSPSSSHVTTPVIPQVSDHSTCKVCALTFSGFESQRVHFRTDWHKYNVKRDARGLQPLTDSQFDQLSDLGSHSSLSGSDTEDEHDNNTTTNTNTNMSSARSAKAERVEFSLNNSFFIVYTAALPDAKSIQSLSSRGSWAVIMTGGGHFCAALWDVNGILLRHKTFHRYTSRKKQGGSQAAADAARGNANRIRSAGATLRRYGEQALESEVHALLKAWQEDLIASQCIFIRASLREKQSLLYGWEGSPLKQPFDEGRIRNIPIPTRRPTLKEATRVYEELSTIIISPVSLLDEAVEKENEENQQKTMTATATATATSITQQLSKSKLKQKEKEKEKGTDHLKKREEKPKLSVDELSTSKPKSKPETEPELEPEPEPLDELSKSLLSHVLNDDRDGLQSLFDTDTTTVIRDTLFTQPYFSIDSRLSKLQEGGLIVVAAALSNAELVTWLLEHDVKPSIGKNPRAYLASKNKQVRHALRKFWALYPDRYDYKAAEIPGPLTQDDLEGLAERERQRKNKGKAKKKQKQLDQADQNKTPEQRARELRAAAAEARLLGNRCGSCHKALDSTKAPPFIHGAFKYCSMDCMTRHRRKINEMSSSKR